MTSVEFVIWMRGFMAGARKDEGLGTTRCELLREQLAKVDGVPMPREKRTNLTPPTPVLLPSNLPAPPWDVTCAGVDTVAGDAPETTLTGGKP